MKVLFISLFLVDVLHGSFIFGGESRRPTPKCRAITKEVCTDAAVVQECEDPVETVDMARECYMESELKCHTVPESFCHDETVPVCETELYNFCRVEDGIELDHVTSKVCNTVTDQECTKVAEQKCEDIPKETCTTEQVDECEIVNKVVCVKQAQQNCQDVTTESCDTAQETECKVVVDELCAKEPKQECKDVTYKDCTTVEKRGEVPSTSCTIRVEQECKTVMVDNCRPVSRQECQTIPKAQCRPVTQPRCEVIYVDHCSYVPDHQCSKVPKTTCVPLTEQKCETVLVDSCRDVPRQECKDVSEDVEKKVPSLVCNNEPREVCRDEIKQVCLERPRKVCREEPKEVCNEFKQKTTHQTCKEVVKTNCQPVREFDCNYLERPSSNYNPALQKGISDLVSPVDDSDSSSDLMHQTRVQAQALVNVLEDLKKDPKAVMWVKKNIQGAPCIGSLDDVIAVARAGQDLVTASESGLTVFLDVFTKLKDEKDPVVLMRGTADMLLQMESLIPQLTSISVNTQCKFKPQDSLQGMIDLADLLAKIKVSNSVSFSKPEVRAVLGKAESIVKSTTTFLAEMQDVFKRVSHCSPNPESNIQAVLALGDIFDKVATFINSVDNKFDTTEIRRKNVQFTTLMVDSVQKLKYLKLNFLDCSSVDQGYKTTADLDLSNMAKSLQDLANMIEEVGKEFLTTELDINFDFEFNNEAGSDLVHQIKVQIQALINVLKNFKKNTKGVDWVEKNFQGSSCIGSIEDGISATRASLDAISKSELGLTVFLNTFFKLKDQKDIVLLVRGAADLLLQIESLLPQLATIPLNTRCEVKPQDILQGGVKLQDSLQGMKDLSGLLVTITIAFPQNDPSRGIVERAAGIVDATTRFFTELQEGFKGVSLCNSDSRASAQAIRRIGDMFDKVATLLVNIGSDYDTKEIRRKSVKLTTLLVDSVEKLKDLDFDILDCSSAQALDPSAQALDLEKGYRTTAESLLDLANLIEEVGLEELSTQLGINLDLEFLS